MQTNLSINNSENVKICDPCCGSGNFIISLANSDLDSKCLYGQDIDYINIVLTRINVALLYPSVDYDFLCGHFICDNTLLKSFDLKFEYIIGNPPWGGKFEDKEIYHYKKLYLTANQSNIESFNLFVEKALHKQSLR